MLVPAGHYALGDHLWAKTSQCVAVGIYDTYQAGLVHIHARNDHEQLLEALVQHMDTSSPRHTWSMGICGGVDAFIPHYGYVPGKQNARRVLTYLDQQGLTSQLINKDIISDHVRVMDLTPHTLRILRT